MQGFHQLAPCQPQERRWEKDETYQARAVDKLLHKLEQGKRPRKKTNQNKPK